jgi:RNA polymerase sigma factor (sigma-70 family)
LDLVYSAALRQVRSPQLAEEAAQSVFADLAKNANKLKPDTVLAAWLYAVARRTAIDAVRRESRRQLREQIAMEMNAMNATADEWSQIAPLLDDAMAALDETDRTTILLRYFENKSLREVGENLAISDDAAQKRVSRAVESLREFFSKQRMTIGAGGLAVLISANAVQSAPAGLAASILSASLVTQTIGMTMIHKVLIVGLTAAVVCAGIYAFHLQSQIGPLQLQNASLNSQIAQLQQELADATNQLADLEQENQQLQAGHNDLLRLRGEVTRLRNGLNTSPMMPQAETNSTDPERIQMHIKARFISVPAEDVQDLGVEWQSGAQTGSGKTGFLAQSQFKTIMQALEKASDVEILAEPEVTTLEGRQTQIRATQLFSLNGTNNVEIGSVLDSQCYFSTNSSTFNLNLVASLILLAGDSSQPSFQVLEISNQMSLPPTQTAVLETDIPAGTWLPDFTNASPEARSLLVFVTPTAIDSAGNPVDPNTGKPQ